MEERTLFVVDDHREFREATAWMLETRGYRVRQFATARAALGGLGRPRRAGLRCLLLDVRMPGMDGLDLHDALNARGVRIPVIYLTGHGDLPLAVEAMRKGAVTVLEKPIRFERLDEALGVAFAARTQPVADETPAMLDVFRARLALLSRRETEVMRAIVDGKPNKVCASELDISIKTVETYRYRLMQKLEVRNGPELVRMVMACR